MQALTRPSEPGEAGPVDDRPEIDAAPSEGGAEPNEDDHLLHEQNCSRKSIDLINKHLDTNDPFINLCMFTPPLVGICGSLEKSQHCPRSCLKKARREVLRWLERSCREVEVDTFLVSNGAGAGTGTGTARHSCALWCQKLCKKVPVYMVIARRLG